MTTEADVKEILAHPFDYKWTLQGFGMLRAYLDPDEIERIHIWDTNSAVPDVSLIHNHPWDFESRVFFGKMMNSRYSISKDTEGGYVAADIRTGEGGGLVGDPYPVRISVLSVEMIKAEQRYRQTASEFHESYPTPGTVTVIKRNFTRPRDYATVCWNTPEWVSAEPRPATREEVEHFIHLAKAHT